MAPETLRKRWLHHVALAAASLVLTAAVIATNGSGSWLDGVSLATAYLCLLFMGIALSLGPFRAVKAQPLPLNIYLRRDFGIWAALTGLVHLFVGTEVSMSQAYMQLYVNLSKSGLSESLRAQLFSWGSIAGFVVGIFVLILLLLSNDFVIRVLGARWWKRLQRVAYPAFLLTVLHGFAFQALEARNLILVAVVALVFVSVVVLQVRGFRARRNAN